MTIRSPAHLSFRTEHEGTLLFLRRIYIEVVERGRRCTVDLSPLKSMSWGAALALVAEINRAQELRPGLIVRGLLPTKARLARALQEVGFVEATTPLATVAPGAGRFLKVRSGSAADIQDLRFLDEFLRRIFSPDIMPDRVRGRLKGAIKEALLNVMDHAYGAEIPLDDRVGERRWWIAGMADPEGRCHFVVYDLGVGIPATVPRTSAQRVKEAFEALEPEERKHDFQLIKAAVSAPRSRTGKQGRGRGLPEMRRLIDRVEDGMLWITSGYGHYIYARGAEEIDGGFPMNHRLHGTLVVWRLKVSDALDDAGGDDG